MCPECGLEYGSREWLRLARRWPWRKRFALSLLILFIVMYGPYAWLLAIDYPWNEYRWLWVKLWLGLPAMILAHFLNAIDEVQFIVMHVVSVSGLLIAALLAARGRWWFVSVALGLAFFSIWNSIALYHAFRM